MPIFTNFSIVKMEDGVLTVQLVNPVPIGGWSITAAFSKRLGGDPWVYKYMASGLSNGTSGNPYGASGITIVNSGTGVFQVRLDAADTSGLNSQNIAFDINRTDSGHRTCIAQGYESIFPG